MFVTPRYFPHPGTFTTLALGPESRPTALPRRIIHATWEMPEDPLWPLLMMPNGLCFEGLSRSSRAVLAVV
jgi:hypothetical protein